MRWTTACTTGSATSASSSAIRTSRRASLMLDSLRRPRPRRRSMVPDRRWVRDSNMDAGSFGEAAGDYSLAVAPALRRRNVGAPIRAAMCDTSAKIGRAHTSELQSLMRISYAVFCLKKKRKKKTKHIKEKDKDRNYITH